LALAIIALNWWLPAWRLRLLAALQGVRVRMLTALGLHIISTLGAAVTPGGSGGGAALATALRTQGVPWGRGMALTLQIFVLDMTVLASLAASGALYLVFAGIWQPPLATLALLLAAAAAVGSVALALAAAPRLVTRGLLRFEAWRARRRRPAVAGRAPRGFGAPKLARDYLRAAGALRRAPAGIRVLLWGVNVGAWIAHYAVLWALLNLYQPTPLLSVLASLAIASLVALVVPTPGASGAMEVMVGFGALATEEGAVVASPILLWRAATFYLVFLLGPVVALLLGVVGARARA